MDRFFCRDCGEHEASDALGDDLCGYCSLLSPAMPPSVRTVAEYFEEGVYEGRAMYALHGAAIMSRIARLRITRTAGPVLEPIDLDALLRGTRAGIVRAHRTALRLPEICAEPTCGVFGVCGQCKAERGRARP